MRMVGQDAFLSAGDLDGVYCQHIPTFAYKALWKLCRAEETRRLREDEDRFRELIYRAADLWKKGSRKQALENLYQARSIHGYERNQTYLRLNAAMGKSLRICSLQNVWSRGSDRADDRTVRALPEDSRDPCRCTDDKSGRSLLARFEGDILIRERDGTRRTIRTGRRGVCAAALSGDGKRSSLAFFDGKLIMLDNREGRICWERSGGHMATRLCFDPAGVFLLAGREDGTILVHDPDDGRILKVLTGRKSSVTAMVFSEDGQFLRSDTEDGGVRIWQFDYKYTCD
jgi:WD40 repeat protein